MNESLQISIFVLLLLLLVVEVIV